jgi:hypothetical protein
VQQGISLKSMMEFGGINDGPAGGRRAATILKTSGCFSSTCDFGTSAGYKTLLNGLQTVHCV